jgi:hypothetical protein
MFPEALLLAREPVAWGATRDVLTPENLLKARRMCEAFDEHAHECAVPTPRSALRHLIARSSNSPSCAARWSARRARARRAADRRVPDAAPHEPGRRRDGACDPAGAAIGFLLSGSRCSP